MPTSWGELKAIFLDIDRGQLGASRTALRVTSHHRYHLDRSAARLS